MGKFGKTQVLRWKSGWKVMFKITSVQPGNFQGKTGLLK